MADVFFFLLLGRRRGGRIVYCVDVACFSSSFFVVVVVYNMFHPISLSSDLADDAAARTAHNMQSRRNLFQEKRKLLTFTKKQKTERLKWIGGPAVYMCV